MASNSASKSPNGNNQRNSRGGKPRRPDQDQHPTEASCLTPAHEREQVHHQQQQAPAGLETSEILGLDGGSPLGTTAEFASARVSSSGNACDSDSAASALMAPPPNPIRVGDTVMARNQPSQPLSLASEDASAAESSEAEMVIRDEYLRAGFTPRWCRRRSGQPGQTDVPATVTSTMTTEQLQACQATQPGGEATVLVPGRPGEQVTEVRVTEPAQGIISGVQDVTPSASPIQPAMQPPAYQPDLPPRPRPIVPAGYGVGSGDGHPSIFGALPPFMRPGGMGPVQRQGGPGPGSLLPGVGGNFPATFNPRLIQPPMPGNMRQPFPGVPVPRMQGMRMRPSTHLSTMNRNAMAAVPGPGHHVQPPRMVPSGRLQPDAQRASQPDCSSGISSTFEGQQGHQSRMRHQVPFLQPQDISPQLQGLMAAQYAQQRPPSGANPPAGPYRQPAVPSNRLRPPLQNYHAPYLCPPYPHQPGVYYGPRSTPGPRSAPNRYHTMGVGQQGVVMRPPAYQPHGGGFVPAPFPSITSPFVPEGPRLVRNPSENTIPEEEYKQMKIEQAQEVLLFRTTPQELLSNHYLRESRIQPPMTDYSVILPAPPRSPVGDVTPIVVIPDVHAQFLFYEANFGKAGSYSGPENVHLGVMRCLKQPVGGAVVFFKGDCADIVKYIGNDQLGPGGSRSSRRAGSDRTSRRYVPPKNNSYMTFNDVEAAQSFVRSLCSEGYHARLIEEPALDDCNFFVHNLPNVMTISDLLVITSPFGVVDEICVGPSKFGVNKFNAFFRMATAEDARRAIQFFDRRMLQGYDCEIVAVMAYRFTPNASAQLKLCLADYRMEFLGYIRNNVSLVYGANRPGPSSSEHPAGGGSRRYRDQNHLDQHNRDSGNRGVFGRFHEAMQSPHVDYMEAISESLVRSSGSIGSLEQPSDSDDDYDDSSASFIMPPRLDDGRRSSSVQPPAMASAMASAMALAASSATALGASTFGPSQLSPIEGHGACTCADCLMQMETFLAAERARIEGVLNRPSNANRVGGMELDMNLLRGNNLEPATLNMLKPYLELALMPVGDQPGCYQTEQMGNQQQQPMLSAVTPVPTRASFQGSQPLTQQQINNLVNMVAVLVNTASQQQQINESNHSAQVPANNEQVTPARGPSTSSAPVLSTSSYKTTSAGSAANLPSVVPSLGTGVRTAVATSMAGSQSELRSLPPLNNSVQIAPTGGDEQQAGNQSQGPGREENLASMDEQQAIPQVPQRRQGRPFALSELMGFQRDGGSYAEPYHHSFAGRRSSGSQHLVQTMAAAPNQRQQASSQSSFQGHQQARPYAGQQQSGPQPFGPFVQRQSWPLDSSILDHPRGPTRVVSFGNETMYGPVQPSQQGQPAAAAVTSTMPGGSPRDFSMSSMAHQQPTQRQGGNWSNIEQGGYEAAGFGSFRPVPAEFHPILNQRARFLKSVYGNGNDRAPLQQLIPAVVAAANAAFQPNESWNNRSQSATTMEGETDVNARDGRGASNKQKENDEVDQEATSDNGCNTEQQDAPAVNVAI